MWYRVVAAAKFLGVAPWDLAARPFSWVQMAEAAADAEARAREKQERDGEAKAARHR